MQGIQSMLDIGTGGGEILASLAPFPPKVCATETYPPNVITARKKLEPLGVEVFDTRDDPENERLPFADDSFDLVINRHESYLPSEVFRILAPHGQFITQQCGSYGELDLIEYFKGRIDESMDWTAGLASRQLEKAGFRIITAKDDYPEIDYFDIGAVVYTLREPKSTLMLTCASTGYNKQYQGMLRECQR